MIQGKLVLTELSERNCCQFLSLNDLKLAHPALQYITVLGGL